MHGVSQSLLLELPEGNQLQWDLGVRTRGGVLRDFAGKDWAPWPLWAGICCAMAVRVQVKRDFFYGEVCRTDAAHKTHIFEGKQGDCRKPVENHY